MCVCINAYIYNMCVCLSTFFSALPCCDCCESPKTKALAQHGHGNNKNLGVKIAFAKLHHIPAGLAQQFLYSWANEACFHKHTSC